MKIQFSTDSAAFEECDCWEDIDRILRSISEKVRLGYDYGSTMDINGNKIGVWSI